MEEDKQVVGSSTSNTEKFKPESEVTELTEDDLEQISGGVPDNASSGVHKNRVKSANKNAAAVKDLL